MFLYDRSMLGFLWDVVTPHFRQKVNLGRYTTPSGSQPPPHTTTAQHNTPGSQLPPPTRTTTRPAPPPRMDSTPDKETLEVERQEKRGATIMRNVYSARSEGRRLPVSWNDKGQPIDPGKDDFVGFIGKIARDYVPITLTHFKNLSPERAQQIWEEIHRTFDIEPHRRMFVLAECARLARNYRSSLTRKFLRDREGNICQDPPKIYNINADEWREFVRQRTSERFEELSRSQSERARDPQYPYRGSRLGFARIEQKEVEIKREAGLQITSVSRAEVWRISRSNKTGEIDNAAAQSVVDNMEYLSQSNPTLSSESNTRNDMLALALSKPEHGGRVRGVGSGSRRGIISGRVR